MEQQKGSLDGCPKDMPRAPKNQRFVGFQRAKDVLVSLGWLITDHREPELGSDSGGVCDDDAALIRFAEHEVGLL